MYIYIYLFLYIYIYIYLFLCFFSIGGRASRGGPPAAAASMHDNRYSNGGRCSAFLHVGLLEILASELQRSRREKRRDMLHMIMLTALGALTMAVL